MPTYTHAIDEPPQVLCSVPNPKKALSEIKRVLRPSVDISSGSTSSSGGRLHLIEHVAAPPSNAGLRLTQTLLDPLQQLLADGCHLTRDTLSVVRGAGFSGGVEAKEFMLDGFSLIGPHIACTCCR